MQVRFPSPALEHLRLSLPVSAVATRWLLCCRYSNPDRLRRDLGELIRFL